MIKLQKIKMALRACLNCFFFCLAVYFCITHISVPSSQLGQRVFSGVITASALGLFAGITLTYRRNPYNLFVVFFCGILAVLICIMLTSVFADTAISNPESSLVFFISCLFFWVIFRVCTSGGSPSSLFPASPYGTAPSLMRSQSMPKRKISEADRRSIAAHEAGHALLYAALGRLPDDFHIRIKSTEDDTNSLGYVSGLRLEHCLNYKTESEWFMLVLLAGKKGEISMGLEESLGSSGDMRSWFELATQYLENQYRGLYYPSPLNDDQISSNKAELQTLKAEQSHMLDIFFSMNKELHEELTANLILSGSMKRDLIKTYLDRVQLPESFPKLPHLVRTTA